VVRYGVRRALCSLAAVGALVLAGCGGASSPRPAGTTAPSGPSAAAKPIVIGASVSLTGDFSGPGLSVQQGYQLWADEINRSGGLLGRPVQLKLVDDASKPEQVVTNYQKLITQDKVDLVFGPYSSLLTIPSAQVANRYGYAFLAPAGGGPKVFDQKLHNFFFVQPAPVADNLLSFAKWVLSLPDKPTTVAYAAEDDPFAKPQVDNARQALEKAGLKTVYYQIWPSETADYTPVALAIAHSRADVVVLGTIGLPAAVGFIKAFIQQRYNPKALIEASGPDQGSKFSDAVGRDQTEGIMTASGWWSGANTFHNQQFVQEYVAKFGGKPEDISSETAEAYAVGQVLQQAVEKIKTIDNAKLIDELHADTFQTVEGPMRWDDIGRPQGDMFLVQWQKGQAVPVYPASVAAAAPEYPKPNWH
jgi:branched-chain amino acid transport system substrate-binding protein